MANRVRFALIGCGEIAVQTSKAVLASQSCQVVHCVDVRKELADDLAAKHGAKSGTRFEDALADPDVQAVVLAVPHALHAPIAIAAAKAGKARFGREAHGLHAPRGRRHDRRREGRRGEAGLPLPHAARPSTCGRPASWWPPARSARSLGYQFHAMMLKPPSYWHGGYTGRCKDDWRISLASSGGGMLIMNLVHNLDSFVHILDPQAPADLRRVLDAGDAGEVEDIVSFVMRLQDGALVSLDCSSAAPGKESYGDRIFGEKGQIAFTRTQFGTFTASHGSPRPGRVPGGTVGAA